METEFCLDFAVTEEITVLDLDKDQRRRRVHGPVSSHWEEEFKKCSGFLSVAVVQVFWWGHAVKWNKISDTGRTKKRYFAAHFIHFFF